MWPAALSVDNLSELSEARTGSTSGRSAYSENLEELRALLGLEEHQEVFTDRFRIDRKKLEDMILNDNEALDATHKFFKKLMDATGTHIAWPSRLKIGAKTKKDPHVRVAGRSLQDVNVAKDNIIANLGIRNKQVTLKVNVSYTHHSHIIGEGGQTITRVRKSTGCHIHFPDSNRAFAETKSNQVSITGTMEGVEKARAQVRDLVPLVFCFELPVMGVMQNCTETMSTYIQHISDKYRVHVSYRTRSRFHATLVVVKGREWEVETVKEATLLLIKQLCGAMANQIPVQMTMEISPHHHGIVLGPQSQYLKSIMESTQTQILFPDAHDPNIPVLKRSNITITGQINDVYNARQQLMGSLPITLIFTLSDTKEPLDSNYVLSLAEKLDVCISPRHCPKQNTISVIVKGVERNTASVYEARRRLLDLEETISANIPSSYTMARPPKVFERGELNATQTKPVRLPTEFQLPDVRPAFSPVDLSPIILGSMPMWNMPPWGGLLLPTPPLTQQNPLMFPQCRPTVPPGLGPFRDLSLNSSGYSSFNNTSPPHDVTGVSSLSSLSSTTSSLSSLGINHCNMSPTSTTVDHKRVNDPATPTNSDWLERALESPQPSIMTPGDYDQKRQLAAKAFQNKPKGPEMRIPTPTWSGYGLSLSSPSAAFKAQDMFHKRSELFDGGIWNNKTPPTPQGKGLDIDSMFLSASNNTESMPSGMLKRIQAADYQDLPSLLAAIGLEKYIQLFASQEIDMSSFTMFTDANLREIGVTAYGPRHKMLLAIADIKKRRGVLNAAPGAERKRCSPGWTGQH